MVTVDALPAGPGEPDAFDALALPAESIVLLLADGREALLIKEGLRRIQLSVRSGSLLGGPVRLRYALEGLRTLEPKLLTMRRLLALHRLGRMPASLFPAQRRAARWIEILRTLDAAEAGASQREIAAVLFGENAAMEWRGHSDYLRLRIQRMVRLGRALVNGGYLAELGGDGSAARGATGSA